MSMHIISQSAPQVRPDMLAEAAAYAKRLGWPVFACHTIRDGCCTCGKLDCASPGKHPRTPGGFKDASLDPATIREWWRRWPDANVGIPTGERTFLALDVDPRHGGALTFADLLAEHGALPDTVEALTGGGGRHILFTCPEGTAGGTLAPGVDLKANGGYIIVAPSLHVSGRRYSWEVSSRPEEVKLAPCPPWILSLLGADRAKGRSVTPDEWAATVVEGNRHRELARRAGSLLTRMPAADALPMLLAWNRERCQPALPEKELRQIVADLAKKEAAKPDQTENEKKPQLVLSALTVTELLAADWPPRADVIGSGVLPRGGLGLVAGPPKSGKTILGLQAAVSVAAGLPFLGFHTLAARVLILSGEGGPELLRERLALMAPVAARDRIWCWWPQAGAGLKLDDARARGVLADYMTAQKIGLLVVDPLIRFHQLDENSTAEMARLMSCLHDLRQSTGAAILLIHHTRKAGITSQAGSAGEARGSSVLHGDIDSALMLSARRTSGDHSLHFELRWSAEPSPMLLELAPDTLIFQVTGTLDGRRKLSGEKLREILAEIGPATVEELAAACSCAPRTVRTYLTKLVEEGVVFAVAAGRAQKKCWRLAAPGAT